MILLSHIILGFLYKPLLHRLENVNHPSLSVYDLGKRESDVEGVKHYGDGRSTPRRVHFGFKGSIGGQ